MKPSLRKLSHIFVGLLFIQLSIPGKDNHTQSAEKADLARFENSGKLPVKKAVICKGQRFVFGRTTTFNQDITILEYRVETYNLKKYVK